MTEPRGIVAHILYRGSIVCTATSFSTSPAAGVKDEMWQHGEVKNRLARELTKAYVGGPLNDLLDQNDKNGMLYSIINNLGDNPSLTYVETKVGYDD